MNADSQPLESLAGSREAPARGPDRGGKRHTEGPATGRVAEAAGAGSRVATAARARPGLGSGRERGGGPAGRAAGALTPVLRSSVPPLAAESLVVLRPTSEGSVWDIQLVIIAMVLSTTPILSSGTDIAPGTPPAPAPRWRRLRAPGSLQAAGTAAGRGARPCPRAPSARRRPPVAAAAAPRAPAMAAPTRAPGRVAASPLPAVRCRPPAAGKGRRLGLRLRL